MVSFEVSRSVTIAAPPAQVHSWIDDFHGWRAWSPWEEVDPNLQREYGGPDAGVGARYEWRGNRKAGQGSMEITGSEPEQIAIRLEFLKPFKASNDVEFDLTPAGDGTQVTWRMSGEQHGLPALFSRIVSMDRLVGRDFEKGLGRLKAAAEGAQGFTR